MELFYLVFLALAACLLLLFLLAEWIFIPGYLVFLCNIWRIGYIMKLAFKNVELYDMVCLLLVKKN